MGGNNLVSALKTILLFCLGSGLIFALDPTRKLDQFSYQTWQTGSGLPQNTVHDILQTRDGYLWVATEGGLARFDGYRFTVFDSRNTPALPSDNIRGLVEDNEGTLWIATTEGICRHGANGFERFASAGDAAEGYEALSQDAAGSIWGVNSGELTQWSGPPPQKKKRYAIEEGSPKLTGALASGADGALWVGTQSGLKRLENERLADAAGNLPTGAAVALLADMHGRLWVGTAKGLFVSRPRDWTKFEAVPELSGEGGVSALFKDREGRIWVGTQDGARRVSEMAGRPVVEAARAAAGANVLAMTEDAEGDLWIGTESEGATVVRSPKFITYTTRDGLADDAVRCVFENQRGAVSVGTSAGLTQMERGKWKQLTSRSGLSSNVILSLGEDADGNVLAGTPDGLNRIGREGIAVTTSADGLADDFVRSIYRDRDGSLWMGTRRGLSHQDNAHRFTTYTQADGLGSDLAGVILRDRGGDLWVGTLNGLSRFENGKFKTYRTGDGLSSNVITALHEDEAGDLWIGTQDAGLNVRENGRILRLPPKLGLPDSVFGIVEDSNGGIWFASKAGIVLARREELKSAALGRQAAATIVWYGTSDGLRISECSAGGHPEVWRGKDGTLWFSTVKGLAALPANADGVKRTRTPVVIESVTIGDQTYEPKQVHEIGPGYSRIAFEYASLNFAAPQKVLYRYRLEGFDRKWVEAGTQRTAYYTNIPPGRYRFRVAARNNDGIWNEAGSALGFRLAPHFYQTVWFYGLAVLAMAGAGYLVYRWRVAEVEARFNAVLQERNRIGREIHDTLAQGFVGVSMQLEIVSRLLTSSSEAARAHLDQARVLVRESLAEARRSIWQLRSQSAESEDLAARFSKTAQQAIGLSPVKLSLEVRGTYRPLASSVEDELLRIGQEAVANALRHASPTRIRIELAYAAKKLRMTVADDGCGFEAGSYETGPNGHFGLKGMRERAEQIDARLVVDSAVGKGTKVLVEAPLN